MNPFLWRVNKESKNFRSTIFTKVQKPNDDMVGLIKQQIQKELVDGKEETKSQFKVGYSCPVVGTGDELQEKVLVVQSALGKTSEISSSRVTETLDTGSDKGPVGGKNARKTGKATGSKILEKPVEGPLGCNGNMDVDLPLTDVLQISSV